MPVRFYRIEFTGLNLCPIVGVFSRVKQLRQVSTGKTFAPPIYQFTRNNEEREMLKLGLVKPNGYPRSL